MPVEDLDTITVASLVLNYGRADLAARAVESLLGSTLSSHRVLLADNGSPDQACCRDHARRLGVEMMAIPENLGFAEGMNRAVAVAEAHWRPEFLFLLNSDARVEPATLDLLVNAARETGAAFVAPLVLLDETHHDGVQGLDARHREPKIWAAGGEFRRFRGSNWAAGESDRGQFSRREKVSFLSGCALLTRVDAFRALHGFDERFFLYQEDVDLCLRARAQDLVLLFEPAARVFHVGSASSGDAMAPLQSFFRWRNRLLLLGKHLRGAERLFFFSLYFPALAARDVVRYVLHGRVRSLVPLCAGLWDWLRGARRPWKPR